MSMIRDLRVIDLTGAFVSGSALLSDVDEEAGQNLHYRSASASFLGWDVIIVACGKSFLGPG
jgi:hypothetical protein